MRSLAGKTGCQPQHSNFMVFRYFLLYQKLHECEKKKRGDLLSWQLSNVGGLQRKGNRQRPQEKRKTHIRA